MLLWDESAFHPYTAIPKHRPALTINLLASRQRKGFEEKVRFIYDSTTKVKDCFSELSFRYPDYNSSDSTFNDDSNISFINSVRSLPIGLHLRINVACLSLRENWLEKLLSPEIDQAAWIISDAYSGISELEELYETAVHTCGIYHITSKFMDFIDTIWSPVIKKYTLLCSELSPIQMLYKALNDSTFKDYSLSKYLRHFVAGNSFAHHDGPYENKHYDGVALRRLLRDESILIGISKHLFRELETIDINYNTYRKKVRLFFRENQI